MIYIDFFGGLHGNFLCFCINSLVDIELRKFNVFTLGGTSHKSYIKTIAQANHYSHYNKDIPTKNIISIRAELSDCLLVNLLCYERAGDYNFDLNSLHLNFYNKVRRTTFSGMINQIETQFNIDVKNNKDLPKYILRQFFKYSFNDYSKNALLQQVFKQTYSFPVYDFCVRDFYNFDNFVNHLENIKKFFILPGSIDREFYFETWQKFIKKITQLQKEADAYDALLAIRKNIDRPIKFNIMQEAWLNAQLENLFKLEMPIFQEEYFETTGQIIEYLNLMSSIHNIPISFNIND